MRSFPSLAVLALTIAPVLRATQSEPRFSFLRALTSLL
jgi:hypothetical protein